MMMSLMIWSHAEESRVTFGVPLVFGIGEPQTTNHNLKTMTMMPTIVKGIVATVVCLSFLLVPTHGLAALPKPQSTTTIVVCTGVDCRLDGATECLRRLQRAVPDGIKVTGQPCLGPCGDGPNIKIVDENEKRVVQTQEDRGPGSLVPAELFGSNPRGIYQVRTARNINRVVRIATDAAGLDPKDELDKDASVIVIPSNRQPYDRPRNERKVLQRLMQVSVAVGLSQCDQVDTIQGETAALLFFLSSFVMRENIFTLIQQLIQKRISKD